MSRDVTWQGTKTFRKTASGEQKHKSAADTKLHTGVRVKTKRDGQQSSRPAASEGISLEYLSNILATSRRLFSFQFSYNLNAGFYTTYTIYRLLFRWGPCRSHVFEADSHFRQTLVSLLLGSTSLPYYPRGKFDFHVRTTSSYYQLFTWSLCSLLTFLFVVGFPGGFLCCLLNHIPKEPFSLKLIPYLQTLTHNKILHSAWHLLILHNYYQ